MFCQRPPQCPLAWLWLNSALHVQHYLINKHTFNSTFSQNTILVLVVYFFHSRELDFQLWYDKLFPKARGDVNSAGHLITSRHQLVGILYHAVTQSFWRTCCWSLSFWHTRQGVPSAVTTTVHFCSNSSSCCAPALASHCHLYCLLLSLVLVCSSARRWSTAAPGLGALMSSSGMFLKNVYVFLLHRHDSLKNTFPYFLLGAHCCGVCTQRSAVNQRGFSADEV